MKCPKGYYPTYEIIEWGYNFTKEPKYKIKKEILKLEFILKKMRDSIKG